MDHIFCTIQEEKYTDGSRIQLERVAPVPLKVERNGPDEKLNGVRIFILLLIHFFHKCNNAPENCNFNFSFNKIIYFLACIDSSEHFMYKNIGVLKKEIFNETHALKF